MDIKLRKVSDGIYEIPKEDNMNVPVRIYANDNLIEKMKQDKTLIQGRNATTLPGIQKYFVIMPDGHEGYGFPVGGVGAFDINEGIISPGAIGYDINCLGPNEKVLFYERFYVRAKDLDKFNNNHYIVTFNNNIKEVKSFMFLKRKLRKEEKIYVIETESGRKLEVSYDHPIYILNKGWVYAKDIKEGDEIIIYPFEGVEYEEPKDKLIIDKENLKEYDIQIIKYLEERNLLPLKLNNPKIGILARIFGYILENGNFRKLNDQKISILVYTDKYGLKRLIKDLKNLNINSYKIYKRTINNKKQYIIEVSNEFSILLKKLGVSYSKKITEELYIPGWIKESPKWIKSNFISGLFGNNLKKTSINLKFVKTKDLENNLVKFLKDLSDILKEFNIESKIYKLYENQEKIVYRLFIDGEDNIYNFLNKIGCSYSYNEIEGLKILEYLRRKRLDINKKSYKYEEILNSPSNLMINGEEIFYNLEYREFIKEYYLDNGLFKDKIIKIELKDPEYNEVYDISLDKNNNFFANNILVHNCGVRLLRTNLKYDEIKPKIKEIVNEIFRNVPAGVGESGKVLLSPGQFKDALEEGLDWSYREGYAWKEDMNYIESYGKLKDASIDYISDLAIRRGIDQLGTLGSGNHFLEIQVVDKIFDEEIGKIFGIEEGQVTIFLHTGSRGFGHQTASDYIDLGLKKYKNELSKLPDRELVYLPFQSEDGQRYWKSMSAAANFAWNNRQIITYWIRKSFEKIFNHPAEDIGLNILYDVSHNIAKIEQHEIDRKKKSLIVHRKGATRAFPAGSDELVEKYRKIGQPVLIPGSMGTASYILLGYEKSMELSFGSSAHGAGRNLSRAAAKRQFNYNDVLKELEGRGILIKSTTKEGVVEEVPEAYKNVDEVAKITENLGISKIIARLKPIAVIKG